MRSVSLVLLLLATIAMISLSEDPMFSIVPMPKTIEPGVGVFTMTKKTPIIVVGSSKELKSTAVVMARRLTEVAGFAPSVKVGNGKEQNAIVLLLAPKDTSLGKEGYSLVVGSSQIRITAATAAGTFYGLQTLLQLIPTQNLGSPSTAATIAGSGSSIKNQQSKINNPQWQISCARIVDSPRFGWRGMHLDVSRHFFPKEFVKTYIDMLAMHKMNVFHWHLVDDQGWRIEIKKYPKLTEVGAWRVDQEDRDWRVRTEPQPGEKATYGGFYTQEEIREVVKYSADRHITVVPEIEMPAHVRSALAAYPEYSCSGKALTVPPGTYWPSVDIYCAGNDGTFSFLENIMAEVLKMFPSKFIHIGGDEADKTAWKACEKCQTRIKQEGLKDEGELQSYFVKRMEKYLVSHGRRLIGWDEILEGGLAPEATVMSWRGIVGGIEAARQGHDVVMTPTDFCYFDYYQGTPAFEPQAIGGYVPLSKVYRYEPVPDSLTAEEAKHILGAQANMWSEYIPTPSHAQYMALPRMAAIAEVVWSPKESRNWNDFSKRIGSMTKRYERFGYNYAKSSYLVTINLKVDASMGKGSFILSTETQPLDIRYTLDGSEPSGVSSLYTGPIEVDKSVTLRAASFSDTTRLSAITDQSISLHLASFKPVKYMTSFKKYTGGGEQALTDGMRGSKFFSDGRWQGFHGVDVDVIIDLGEVKSINKISTSFLQNSGSWIFLPTAVAFLVSENGERYAFAGAVRNEFPGDNVAIGPYEYSQLCPGARARYIQLTATTIGPCPEWHPGKGQPSWLFIDEIVVE